MKLFFGKRRRYPIKRDEFGQSSRKQAFALFDKNYRPAQIHRLGLLPVKRQTLFRYFEDWKKRHIDSYTLLRRSMKEHPELTERVIKALSKTLEIPIEQVVKRMEQPWGLLRLLKGELPKHRLKKARSDIENRLDAALRLILFVEHYGHKKPEEVRGLIINLINEVKTKDDKNNSN